MLAASVYGYVCPPSVESVTFTFAAEIGAAFVPATFQVTVCVEPPGQLTAVFGAETTNGPVPGARLSCMSGSRRRPCRHAR